MQHHLVPSTVKINTNIVVVVTASLVPGKRKPSQFSVNSTRLNTDTFCGSLRVRIHGVRVYKNFKYLEGSQGKGF